MKTEIKLKDTQAALIMDEDGKIEIILPDKDDDEFIPEYILFMATIAILIKKDDEEFFDFLIKKWEELVGTTEESIPDEVA